MQVLALVLDVTATEVTTQTTYDFFATDQIDIKHHKFVCEGIVDYSQRRHPLHKSAFHIRTVKQGPVDNTSVVHFGAAVLADNDVFSLHEINTLRTEISDFSRRFVQDNGNLPIDYVELGPETLQARLVAQEQALAVLKKNHGGTKIRRPLQILCSDIKVADLRTKILTKPDAPLVDTPDLIEGQVGDLNFSKRLCSIESQSKPGIIKAYIKDSEMLLQVAVLGAKRVVASFSLRNVQDQAGHGQLCELLKVSPVSGDSLPLFRLQTTDQSP